MILSESSVTVSSPRMQFRGLFEDHLFDHRGVVLGWDVGFEIHVFGRFS